MSIRVYARIWPFVMHSHKFLSMKHCWSNKGHMGMKRLQSEIWILLKLMPINESYHISSFRSLHKFIDRFFDLLDLKLPNMGRKLKQSLEIPILTRELYLFTRKDLCFGTGRKSFATYFLSEFSVLKINPCRKNYISHYIWQRSFIQMVKCSFLDEKFVYQSFYHAPFTFSYFLLQGKVLCCACVNKSLARCLFVESVRTTLSKKLYLQLYLTQIVHSNGKMHFLFLFVFHMLQVACKMFICQKRSKDLVKKIISPVIFDTNRSFKR